MAITSKSLQLTCSNQNPHKFMFIQKHSHMVLACIVSYEIWMILISLATIFVVGLEVLFSVCASVDEAKDRYHDSSEQLSILSI